MWAERKCPVTTFPALCYQIRCESDPCLESIEQELRYNKKMRVWKRRGNRRPTMPNPRRKQTQETEV